MSSVHVPEQVAPMIPRTLFNSDHEAFRKTARRFFEQEIAPFHEKWEGSIHCHSICRVSRNLYRNEA